MKLKCKVLIRAKATDLLRSFVQKKAVADNQSVHVGYKERPHLDSVFELTPQTTNTLSQHS